MLKKTLTALMAVSALSMALPATAQAGWFSSDKAAHDRHHEKGPREGMRELKLTDAQKQQMRDIHREQRQAFREKMHTILTPEQREIAAKHEAKRKAHRDEKTRD